MKGMRKERVLPNFFRKTDLVLIVCDFSTKMCERFAAENFIKMWIKEIKQYCDKGALPVILIFD